MAIPLPGRSAQRGTFASLSLPNFRYFYFGQGLSLLGSSARTMALGWTAFQLTHSPFELGLVHTFTTLPILLFSVYAGSVADRFPKLSIFKAASWAAFTVSLAFTLLAFSNGLTIGRLLAFAPLWGAAMAFEMPARQALVMDLVGEKNLVNAISLNSALLNASRVLGPALGGVLLASFGASWCFLLDALSFLAVLYGLHHIRLKEKTGPRSRRGPGGNLEGFRFIRREPLLLRSVSLLLLMTIGAWAYQSQLPSFVQIQLSLQVWGYAWILTAAGLGSCAAALTIATRGKDLVKESTLYSGILLYGVFILFFGFQHGLWASITSIFGAAFGFSLFFSTTNSLLQIHSPSHLRGRIMGIWSLVFGGAMPIGSFLMGLAAGKMGPGTALQAGGVVCLVAAGATFFFSKKFRD